MSATEFERRPTADQMNTSPKIALVTGASRVLGRRLVASVSVPGNIDPMIAALLFDRING